MPCSRTKYPGSELVYLSGVTLWVSNPRNGREEVLLAEHIRKEGAEKVERARAAGLKQQQRKRQEEKKRDLERRRGDSYRPATNPHLSPARVGNAMDSRIMNAPRGPRLSPYSKDPGTQLSVPIVPWPVPKENIAPSNASSENDVIDRLEMALFPPTADIQPLLAPSAHTEQANFTSGALDHPTIVGHSPVSQLELKPPGVPIHSMVSDPSFSQPSTSSQQNNQIPKEIEDILLPPTPTSDAPSLPENVPQPFNLFQHPKTPLINPFRTSSPTKENIQSYYFGQPSQPPTPSLSVFTSPDKNIPELGSNEETVPELRRRLALWHEAWEKQDKELEELRDLHRSKDQEIFKLREERISKNKELDRLNHLLTAAEEAGRILEKRNQAALRLLEGRN